MNPWGDHVVHTPKLGDLPQSPPRSHQGLLQQMPLTPANADQHTVVGDLQASGVKALQSMQGVQGGQAVLTAAQMGPPSPAASLTPSRMSGMGGSKKYVQGATSLSARGINPEKHPELHAKEMAEMRKVLDMHCGDSAELVDRTTVRCMWCKDVVLCPPYRPQSFFFKDISSGGMHDGHFWTCQQNPNVTLQAGRGVNIGDGKVMI
mmetsp:Transcript_37346/g.72939  ORF Transcript_37346/g.72939 Transcript_37346/m.72939 type:complete len:206 (+) Transcript_37346:2-619(+)